MWPLNESAREQTGVAGGKEAGDGLELRHGYLEGKICDKNWLVEFYTLIGFDFRWGVRSRVIKGRRGAGGRDISTCAQKL